jgi:hypothetical protein
MAQVSRVLARLKQDPLIDLPVADRVDRLLGDQKVTWRDRLLPPLVTLRLLLVQIAHRNCAIAALRQLGGIPFAASSYCEARARLPVQLLQSLLEWVRDAAAAHVAATARLARRILFVDGSSYSMPDAPGLAAHFHLPPGARRGVGYPMGKLMGLLDAATGMFVSLLALPLFGHDVRGAVEVHPMLGAGDILLGDRAFCSFAHLALLRARGVFACVRLHQRRKVQGAGAQRWPKDRKPPAWVSAGQYAQLPEFIDVRVVRYTVAHAGYRTTHVLVATTLPDDALWPDRKVAELYGHRWDIETCFDHLKTTMGMSVLRCRTLDGVTKELAAYLVVYNLIRLAVLKAAEAQRVDAARVSFVDAMRLLAARLVGLAGVAKPIVNPNRPGRTQLRVIRRRGKEYDWLLKPRREKEAEIARKQAEIG